MLNNSACLPWNSPSIWFHMNLLLLQLYTPHRTFGHEQNLLWPKKLSSTMCNLGVLCLLMAWHHAVEDAKASAWTMLTKFKSSMYHYNDVIMSMMASQITSLVIVYSTVYSGTDQRKHQSSRSLAFVRGIHRWPLNSPHKGPVMQKMFPFDDFIMYRISASNVNVKATCHV